MKKIATVTKIENETIYFSNMATLRSYHESECCEIHYLDINSLDITEFDGLEFDLNDDKFFERVQGSGIRLVPTNGHPIFIPGYSDNNGYYSDNLSLILTMSNGDQQIFDITECQS